MSGDPFNIIISGLGGQGVFTLTKTIWTLCQQKRIKCQSSTFKGSATKHGSIYSALRIFFTDNPFYHLYSTQIPAGELDLMIGMEPWETLRYRDYFGKHTRIFMNCEVTPFRIERLPDYDKADPVAHVLGLNLTTVAYNYTSAAIQHFGKVHMANVLLGLEVMKAGVLQFSKTEYIDVISKTIKADKQLKLKLATC